MDPNLLGGIVYIPAILAMLLLLLFTYLYHESHEPYFRAWQLGWAAYLIYYGFVALEFLYFTGPRATTTLAGITTWVGDVLFTLTMVCIFASVRLLEERFSYRWYDFALLLAGALWAGINVYQTFTRQSVFTGGAPSIQAVDFRVGLALLLAVAAIRFWWWGQKHEAHSYKWLAVSLMFWAVLLATLQWHQVFESVAFLQSVGHFLGPLPQMMLGISMVMVLFENERRNVQEHLLAFSRVELQSSDDLSTQVDGMLDRMLSAVGGKRMLLCARREWERVLPVRQRGLSADVAQQLQEAGAAECFADAAAGRGGLAEIRDFKAALKEMPEAKRAAAERVCEILRGRGAAAITVVGLKARDRSLGTLVFPHGAREEFSLSRLKLVRGLASQMAMTLDNQLLMQESRRRTQEYELLTEIGKAVTSRLDQDEVLRAIHHGLGQLFDTSNFYVAFAEGDKIHFELEVENGVVLAKRTRKRTNGLSEYVIDNGKPLLIREDAEQRRAEIGVVPIGRPSSCCCAVPILRDGKAAGVMAVLGYERENLYRERDLEVMMTASSQLSIAIDNARLFAEEHHRAKRFAFLNSVSKTAISSSDSERMLDEIVGEIQQNFNFDHIGIGILDYTTKEIEIKAEAGTFAKALGKRVPLGVGILGRVARTSEMALVQGSGERLLGIMAESRSVLSIPLAYADTLLGVLNIESRQDAAFTEEDVLILRTLADLISTALHNAFVYQKLEQQSITDPLTGIKTRRFFSESLSAEWKRASRSGRPFSVVLIDLDKFKQVNDSMGHLEGDLVLARIGRLLEQKVRQSNVVARYGGDEFVILMPETGVEQAQILSERLRLWIATDPMLNERHITGSFGVATFPLHGATVEDIIRVADAGMYVSKHAGGNRVSTAEEFLEGEGASQQRQLVTSYVEGFLRREHTGPESADELVSTLKRLGEAVKDGRSVEALMEAVSAITRAAETREMYCGGHGESVARFAELMGRELLMSPEEINDLVLAARVHDVGKIVISEKVLNKPSALSFEEYQLVKEHTAIGARIVSTVPGSARLESYVRSHHERYDGTGYPDGLKGEAIPLGARIIAVAEAYTNMTLERPYAPIKSMQQAVDELEELSGSQFDGAIVRVFVKQLEKSRTAGANA